MFLECHLSKTINLKKIGHFSFSCSYKKHAHRPKAMEWSTYIILGSKREHRARDWVLGTRSACAVRTGVMSRRQEVGWTWNSKIWFRKCWVGSKNFLIYNHDRRGTRFQFRRRQSKIMSLYVRVLVCHFWELEVVEFCNKKFSRFLQAMHSDHRESSRTREEYLTQREQCMNCFTKWTETEQVEFVEFLISKMCHYQHGHINSFLKPMLQRDFITALPGELLFSKPVCFVKFPGNRELTTVVEVCMNHVKTKPCRRNLVSSFKADCLLKTLAQKFKRRSRS